MAEEVQVYVEDTGGNGVENVYVGLHDSSSKALLQTDTTDSDGLASFSAVDPALNSGVYEIRIVPSFPGTLTDGKVQNITVLDTPPPETPNEFVVEVTKESLPTATNPRLCRCSGYFVDAAGQPAPDITVFFTEHCVPKLEYQSESNFTAKAVVPSRLTARTDSDGYMVIDLYRDAIYEVHAEGFINISRDVKIPDLSAANMPDILFPVVGTVKWYESLVQLVPTEAPTKTVSLAGGADTLTIEVILRSGTIIDSGEVTLASDDTAVVTVSKSDDTVTLTPVTTGSATITVTRMTNDEDGDIISPVPSVIGTLSVTVSA